MRASAERELLAPRADVWAFLAEPYHLSDWWPGVTGVQPDRRGLAPGARWSITAAPQTTLVRRPTTPSLLLVREVEPPERVSWHLTAQRLDVEVRLAVLGTDRTVATVTIEGPWRPELLGTPRRLPKVALGRLHDLCQTAATL